MNLRKTLSRRVRELMDRRVDLDTQMKLRTKTGLAQATVGRVLSAQTAATVDSVEALAKAFGVSAMELMADSDTDVRLMRALSKLSAEDKVRILHYIEVSSQVAVSQTGIDRRTWVDTRPAPPSLVAASSRASARKVSPDDMTQPDHDQNAETTKRPISRRKGTS